MQGDWNKGNVTDIFIYCRIQKHIRAHNVHVHLAQTLLQQGQRSAKPTLSENKLHHITPGSSMCLCSNPFSRLQRDTHDVSTQLWEQGPKRDSLPFQIISAVLPKSSESSSAPTHSEQVGEPSTPSTARISPSLSLPLSHSQQLAARRGRQNKFCKVQMGKNTWPTKWKGHQVLPA